MAAVPAAVAVPPAQAQAAHAPGVLNHYVPFNGNGRHPLLGANARLDPVNHIVWEDREANEANFEQAWEVCLNKNRDQAMKDRVTQVRAARERVQREQLAAGVNDEAQLLNAAASIKYPVGSCFLPPLEYYERYGSNEWLS